MAQKPITQRKGTIITVAVVAFLAYCGWILGPYLRSVIIRDAAVTS